MHCPLAAFGDKESGIFTDLSAVPHRNIAFSGRSGLPNV